MLLAVKFVSSVLLAVLPGPACGTLKWILANQPRE